MSHESHQATRPARLRARGRIWLFCLLVLVAVGVSALVSLRPLSSGIHNIQRVHRDAAASQRVGELRSSLADFQLLLEPGFAAQLSAATTANNLAKAAQLVQTITTQSADLEKSLPPLGRGDALTLLKAVDAQFTKACAGLAPLASGMSIAKGAALIAAERAGFAKMWSVTATLGTQLTNSTVSGLQASDSNFDAGRTTMFVILALTGFATLALAFVVGQRARHREREERASDQRQHFGTALQEAFEMSKAESDVYSVVAEAFQQTVPDLHVEMLVADSSRAHFHQTVNTGSADNDNRYGCGVVSPQDCPATVRGHALVFSTSTALNACPHLRAKPSGSCSAVCIPISVAGKTVGVTHAVGPDAMPPNKSEIGYLEITSRRASERIAMVRAFEKSEKQARSDPLTGLWNRRSLENQVHDLQRQGVSYALAYGDLDHFKHLNDTHGHEAGDQALRLFSRVLRDSIRPNDVAARYGGEEFVIVLPECSIQGATVVLERIRERLGLALSTGRNPSFTVSFGLASSADADTFDGIVATADRALLSAKAAGRNRVVVAVESGGSEWPATDAPVLDPTPVIS